MVWNGVHDAAEESCWLLESIEKKVAGILAGSYGSSHFSLSFFPARYYAATGIIFPVVDDTFTLPAGAKCLVVSDF